VDCPHGSALEYYWLECLPAHAVSVSSLVSYMCAMRRPPIRGQFMTANDCTRYCYACNRRLVNHLHRGCLTVVLRNCTRVSKELSFLITCSFNDFNNESCDRYSLFFFVDDHTHWQRWACFLLIQLLGCHIEINACLVDVWEQSQYYCRHKTLSLCTWLSMTTTLI